MEEMTNQKPYRNPLTGRVAYMTEKAARHFPSFVESRTDKPEVLQTPEQRAEQYEGLLEQTIEQDVEPTETFNEEGS